MDGIEFGAALVLFRPHAPYTSAPFRPLMGLCVRAAPPVHRRAGQLQGDTHQSPVALPQWRATAEQ